MKDPTISVVMAIAESYGDHAGVFREFAAVFRQLGEPFEFIFVLDGGRQKAFRALAKLDPGQVPVRVAKLSRPFGESALLKVGLRLARGEYIFTVPQSFQVDPEGVKKLWEELRSGCDLAVAWRHPRTDSVVSRVQARLFHAVVGKATGVRFHDISCRLRAMKRNVLEEVNVYGGLHRFIPVLAAAQGFKVREVPVPQRRQNVLPRFFGFRRYTQTLLDILTLFFVTRFTVMPLRFFGGVAAGVTAAGLAITGYLGLYRLLGYGPIANRPLLLLGILLIAVGLQVLSLGLIGELVLFLHARTITQYRIEEVIEQETPLSCGKDSR